MKIFLLILVSISLNVQASLVDSNNLTKTPEDDHAKIEEYNQACQIINALLVKKQFQVGCFSNYQYFGPTSKSLTSSGTLKIAGYNLLHPGTSKALFKDYSLVAKIMNQYDVVSTLEVLGVVGHDKVNNDAVVALLRSSPKIIEDLKNAKAKTTDSAKLKLLDEQIKKLSTDTQIAYNLYRPPGYFKLLTALKKLDPSWSLILSPRGDSALQGSVEEMVGFFFRANNVSPVVNPHCDEFKDENAGTPVACIINLSSNFMEKDYTHNFARRPFMASFRSGSMKFSLVSSHVVFNFSGDENGAKKLMKDVFGVETPSALGGGINLSNFARFAETKMTLEFMNRFRNKYNDKNIMYVADTNLTANNSFWNEVLKSFTGGSLLINEPTTISPVRYSGDGKETFGVASSYDHFVLDKTVFSNCNNGEVYNYYKNDIDTLIQKIYGVGPRSSQNLGLRLKRFGDFADDGTLADGDIPPEDNPLPAKLDYPISADGKYKMDRLVSDYSNEIHSLLTVKRNSVELDDFQVEERIDGFKRRVFTNQLTNAFYYRPYQEILSDHFPVSITCKSN